MANIDYWADRAATNSKLAPRAKGGEIDLPSTGKRIVLRDTASAPKVSRKVDARMVADKDTNFVGSSSYMKGIKREA
jgi:hypothetical protein